MCLHRDLMPQVDDKDLPSLLGWLNGRRLITVRERLVPPQWLQIRQCLEETRACRRIELLKKPLLISMDLGVLDGNHRLLRHIQEGSREVPCLEIGLSFENAMEAVLTFPKAYRFADDPQPIRE